MILCWESGTFLQGYRLRSELEKVEMENVWLVLTEESLEQETLDLNPFPAKVLDSKDSSVVAYYNY